MARLEQKSLSLYLVWLNLLFASLSNLSNCFVVQCPCSEATTSKIDLLKSDECFFTESKMIVLNSGDCLFKESKMVVLKSGYCFFKMRIIYRTSLDRIYNQRFRKIFILNVINMLFFIFCNCCRSVIQKYVCYTI